MCSTPRGTGPQPWLLDRQRPAGRQQPQVRGKYPARQNAPSSAIAALKWAISRHAAGSALAVAGLTSNSPSSSLVAPRSACDGGSAGSAKWQLRVGSDGERRRGYAGHAKELPVNSKLRGSCIGT